MTDQPWGRVEEDGTVYVRTADGERIVGSWQAGSPDEALSFYQRRFEGLVVETSLLEKRLKAGGVDPESAMASIGRMRAQVADAAAVGDLEGLARRLDAMVALVDERREAVVEERKAAKAEALAAREAIAVEAEALSTSTAWKASGDRFRVLLDEWKAAPRVDRAPEQQLWKRFSTARTSFDRSRRAHFAALDAERGSAKEVKATLVEQAEALAESSEWVETSRRYRDLMTQWKVAGRAGKGDDDALWNRFKAAQDAFFSRRNAQAAEQDEEYRANLVVKEQLADQAESLLPITALESAKAALRDISRRWEAAGHVPREDRPRIEGRLKKVEDAVRQAEQDQWRRSDPAAKARAQSAVDQLEAAIVKLEVKLAKAESAESTKAADDARESIAARREWLAQAQAALDEFSR